MAVKKYKPATPGTRGMTGYTFEEITKSKPERSLLLPLHKSGGRNAYGRVTVRHRGGGHRRFIRIVDFKRDKRDIPAKVAAIEYDPNRTARLALLHYADGEKRYIVAPLDLKVGDAIMSGAGAEIRSGNALPISNIPSGAISLPNENLNMLSPSIMPTSTPGTTLKSTDCSYRMIFSISFLSSSACACKLIGSIIKNKKKIRSTDMYITII